jgi:hypothetical protein
MKMLHMVYKTIGIPLSITKEIGMVKKPVLPEIETRTVPLSLKVTTRVARSIEKAATDNKRSKSALICDVMEIWLKEHGYLK